MIYIDISHLSFFINKGWGMTGIQRVTWECASNLRRQLGASQVRLFRSWDNERQQSEAPVALLQEMFDARHDKALLAKVQGEGANAWKTFSPQKNDVLLLSEGLVFEPRFQAISDLKARHALRIALVMYDVIPIARPEFCLPRLARDFNRQLPLSLKLADRVISISEFTKADLLKHCAALLRPGLAVDVWKLPHEFPIAKDDLVQLPEIVKERFVVFTGTIENRKNQQLAVKAWRKLMVKHGDRMPQLVLVGKFGKITKELIQTRISLWAEQAGKQRMIVLNKCNDKTLRALYDRCEFSIYISSYEGWGLPIGESLWCGKPVLSGTETSLPEVGGGLVDYVTPENEQQLAAAIEKLCFDEPYRALRSQEIGNAKLRSWPDAVKDLSGILARA